MIPQWLTEKLSSPPQAGAGIHAWLFSTARQLHAHMAAGEIFEALTSATAGCERRVTRREIRDAVNNSHAVKWERKGGEVRGGDARRFSLGGLPDAVAASDSAARWPRRDDMARKCRIADSAADGIAGLADLWELSRPADLSADDWLDRMLPDAEWLCLAKSHPAEARSRRREKWSFGPADECGLVVPSPMTGPSGKGLDGRTSHRCLDNTAARRWLVVEFDPEKWRNLSEAEKAPFLKFANPEGEYDAQKLNEQASLHWHLRECAEALGWPRLALCVHSGGKSLHGWYGPCADEETTRALMEYAVTLGADPATFNRCQLVRLPGGRRAVKAVDYSLPDGWEAPGDTVKQEVFYVAA